MLSGFAMVVVGLWLTSQAIGGNLAGRIRSWAAAATGGDDSSSSSPPNTGGSGSVN